MYAFFRSFCFKCSPTGLRWELVYPNPEKRVGRAQGWAMTVGGATTETIASVGMEEYADLIKNETERGAIVLVPGGTPPVVLRKKTLWGYATYPHANGGISRGDFWVTAVPLPFDLPLLWLGDSPGQMTPEQIAMPVTGGGMVAGRGADARRVFSTQDEAAAAWAEWLAHEKYHTAALRYGSDRYGESRDQDVLLVGIYGEELAEEFYKGGAGRTYPRQADIVHVDERQENNHPMQVLALECAALEYPALADYLRAMQGKAVAEALDENATYRLRVAKIFPCIFTLRKALFSALQKDSWDQFGVFIDRKSQLLDYLPKKIRKAANKLLFHEATAQDERVIYRWLFEAEMPLDVSAEFGDREFYVRRSDGTVLRSNYNSSWDEWTDPVQFTGGGLLDANNTSPTVTKRPPH